MRSSLILVRKHLMAHWVRSGLTVVAMSLALFLLCFVTSIVTTLESVVDAASSRRLVVQSAVSLFVNLPLGYQEKISGVPGVEEVTKFQWFGGYFQEEEQPFAQFGVDHERMFECTPRTWPSSKAPAG